MTVLPEGLAQALLPWYAQNARDLPWRQDRDPYHVWVSEIMLQQTRVEAVKGYYARFMTALPTVHDLAEASEETVLKLWEGLGYYARARNLQKAAKLVMERYDGTIPADVGALRALPGIGEYTAGAIASIAFGLPEPAVDGNVSRLCARLTCCEQSIGDAKVRSGFREQLRAQYPPPGQGDLTSALMELGETVCVPGTPDCDICPLSPLCQARRTGTQTDYPVMPEKRPRKIEEKTVLLLLWEGRAALRKRPGSGLLAGLWEFPNLPGVLTPEEALQTAASWGCEPRSIAPCGTAIHVFTHIEWHMTGYRICCGRGAPGLLWADEAQRRDTYAVPSAFRSFSRKI